jgi:hypothetical protein
MGWVDNIILINTLLVSTKPEKSEFPIVPYSIHDSLALLELHVNHTGADQLSEHVVVFADMSGENG